MTNSKIKEIKHDPIKTMENSTFRYYRFDRVTKDFQIFPKKERKTRISCTVRTSPQNTVFGRQRGTEGSLSSFFFSGVAIRKWARCLRKQRAANIGQGLRKQWTVFGILSRIRGDLAFHHEWKPQCSQVVTKNAETFPKQRVRAGIFSWIVLCLDYWIFWTAYLKYRLFHYWNFQHRKIIKKCFAGTFNIFITLHFHSLNIYIKQSNINLYNSYTFQNRYFGLLTI